MPAVKPAMQEVYPVGGPVETLRAGGVWQPAKVVRYTDGQMVLRFKDGDEWEVEKVVRLDLVKERVRRVGDREPLDCELPPGTNLSPRAAPRPPAALSPKVPDVDGQTPSPPAPAHRALPQGQGQHGPQPPARQG